jgi:hypothetical protein
MTRLRKDVMIAALVGLLVVVCWVGPAWATTIFITSGTTFTAPGDWPGTADTVICIGGGGGGGTNHGSGGGGGGLSIALNVAASNGDALVIGAGGATDVAWQRYLLQDGVRRQGRDGWRVFSRDTGSRRCCGGRDGKHEVLWWCGRTGKWK